MSALGFRVELEKLINRESMENGSNTPDFVLCIYLEECLRAFDAAIVARERYYGREVLSLQKPTTQETRAVEIRVADGVAAAVASFVTECDHGVSLDSSCEQCRQG